MKKKNGTFKLLLNKNEYHRCVQKYVVDTSFDVKIINMEVFNKVISSLKYDHRNQL